MDIEDIIKETRKTWILDKVDKYDEKDIELLFIALALGGEAGELQNLVKKYFRKKYYRKRQEFDEKNFVHDVAEELTDVIFYASRMIELLNIDIEKAMKEKLKINEERYIY